MIVYVRGIVPIECDYHSSTPLGDYDSTEHTVTWDLNDFSADDANCFQIETKVNLWARPDANNPGL